VLRALGERFEPARDVHVLAGTSADTLDFTGPRMNHGSKLILDLTGPRRDRPPLRNLPDLSAVHAAVVDQRLVENAVLLVRVDGGADARALRSELLADARLAGVPLMVLLSSDVDLDDRTSWLWGWFTRFDPAADVAFRDSRLIGCVPRHAGPMAIDATWKRGYPAALEMPPHIVRRVDERWAEYGLPR
jgi:3-polyprenyl-4-hydroxybenzoate decarboxylase